MSKQDLKPKAKELYVIHQMSLADISRAISVSTRTLQNWKAGDNWEIERAQISGGEQTFHAELFALGEVMARKIRLDEKQWSQDISREIYRFTAYHRYCGKIAKV